MSKIFVLLLVLSNITHANNKVFINSEWSNGCGPIIGDKDVTSFFHKNSDIGVELSGTSLCTKIDKILPATLWTEAINTTPLMILHPKFKNVRFKQITSFTELNKQFKKLGGSFKSNIKPAIIEFFSDIPSNPVILYAKRNNEMMVVLATSDGKYASFGSHLFKRK